MGVLRFIKDWTLPVAMTLGAIIYFVFAFTPGLEGVALVSSPFFDAILPLFMFFILLVTFCKVDFRLLRPKKWHAWVCLFQLLLIGLLMAVALHFHLRGAWLVMLEATLMCVISPCAAAAPVVTQKLDGSLEEITTYVFLSNFLTALMVPLCLPLIEKAADMTFWSAFTKMLSEVFLVLVVPMLLAYIIKHHLHTLHRKIVAVRDLSFYLWACSLIIITGTTLKNIVHADTTAAFLLAIALLGLLMCVVQFSVGRLIGHYFNRVQEGGQALGQKNTAFAIWIAYTYLTPLATVGPGCYILWQNIVNSMQIWQHRKKANQEQIQRISRYEAMMQEAERLMKAKETPTDNTRLQELILALETYYGSEIWKQDFAADESGLLPKDLKRGVLSEDGIYNLLQEYQEQ